MRSKSKSSYFMLAGVIAALCGSISASFLDLFMPEFIAFVGAVVLAYGVLLLWAERGKKWAKILKNISHAGFIFVAITFLAAQIFIACTGKENCTFKEKYVIGLGAGLIGEEPTKPLKLRMEKLYEYMLINRDATAIVCGGRGKTEDITEAEAYFRYLTGRGIEPERIILEDKSRNTAQNFRNTAEIIKEREGTTDVSCAVVTSDFHMWRSLFYGRKYGICANAAPAPTVGMFTNTECRVREYFSLAKSLCGLDLFLGFQ